MYAILSAIVRLGGVRVLHHLLPPVVIGPVIMVIGIIGLIAGMATFIVLGYQAISASDPDPTPAPLIGFGIFFVSIIVTGIGSGIHRSGKRQGI